MKARAAFLFFDDYPESLVVGEVQIDQSLVQSPKSLQEDPVEFQGGKVEGCACVSKRCRESDLLHCVSHGAGVPAQERNRYYALNPQQVGCVEITRDQAGPVSLSGGFHDRADLTNAARGIDPCVQVDIEEVQGP